MTAARSNGSEIKRKDWRGTEKYMPQIKKILLLAALAFLNLKARPEEAPQKPAEGASNTASSAAYPALKILDFALDHRRLSVDLGDDYNCPRPLPGGLTLPQSVELPIDLPTVLRLAGCDNLEVQFACTVLEEAEAHTLQAKMQFLPSLYPQFSNKWHSGRAQNTNGSFINVNKQSTQYGGGAVLDWHLGETIFQTLAARRREQAHAAGVEVAAENARYNAVAAYFNLILARTEQAIAKQRLAQADETVKLIDHLVKNGAALLSEVKRVQAVVAEVKQRVATAREKVRKASLALTETLHIDPLVTLLPQQESQILVALVPREKQLAELVADGFARRPELKESRAFWNALDKERKAAYIAPLVPTVHAEAFDGSLGLNPADSHHSADLSVGLGWKVGPGGIGDVSRIRISAAQQRQEGIHFAQVADRIAREIVESETHVKTSEELIQFSKEEVAAAEEALKLSRERLQNGVALTLEVIAAEESLFAAKSRAAQNVAEYNKAEYGLSIRIGGLRESDLQTHP